MLSPTTDAALMALYGFTRQPRWADIDKMLEAEIAAATTRLLGAAELRTIGECQGRIKALQEFQALARDVQKLMEAKGLRAPM